MDKQAVFVDELRFITDEKVREWTGKAIECLPDYFFTIPASSTGKYHPQYALGDGGLVRHTKAAVRIAVDLFNIHNFSDKETDIIISALILHDGAKNGISLDRGDRSGWSRHDHPLVIGAHLQAQPFFNDIPQAPEIIAGIASHMGQWNVSKYSKIILPLPATESQRYIHMYDYLASRKCLEFNFNAAG